MSETLTPMARSSMPAYLNQLSSPDDIGQNEVTVLLTKKGLELRQARPEIESLFLPEYIKKVNAQYLGSTAVDSEIKTRNYIWRGEDAEVYELAPGVAVREVTKRSDPVASVDRMSVLSDLADDKLPDWIGVPDQYGVVIPESTSESFVTMQHEAQNNNAKKANRQILFISKLYQTSLMEIKTGHRIRCPVHCAVKPQLLLFV